MQDERDRGQTTLFGGIGVDPAVHIPPPNFHYQEEYPASEKQNREKAVLGYYISSHPLDSYQREINSFSTHKLIEREELSNGLKVKICGILNSIKVRTSKAGNKWALGRLEDQSGSIEVRIIGAVFEKVQEYLVNDRLLAVTGKITKDDSDTEPGMMVEDAFSLENASSHWGKSVIINLQKDWINEARLDKLNRIFDSNPGNCPVYINLNNGSDETVTYKIGAKVKSSGQLLDCLSEFVGENRVSLR